MCVPQWESGLLFCVGSLLKPEKPTSALTQLQVRTRREFCSLHIKTTCGSLNRKDHKKCYKAFFTHFPTTGILI